MTKDIKVGDTFWFVSTIGDKRQYEVKVIKVSNKYAYLDNDFLIDLKDKTPQLQLMAFSKSHGKEGDLYSSKSAYDQQDWLANSFWELKRFLNGLGAMPVQGVTIKDIHEAGRLLGYTFGEGA